jgi:uncharacterized repeat protein (TIGR02543 family)
MHAQWTLTQYSITYNLSGGTNNGANPANYTIESTAITLAVPTRTGYTFGGWYDNEGFSGNAITGIPAGSTENKTFYAKWTAISYTVQYNANGGTGTTASSVHTYDVPQNLSANSFTKTGYAFIRWTIGADGTGAAYSDEASVNNLSAVDGALISLYAQWSLKYTITYTLNGGNPTENPVYYTVEGLPLTLAPPIRTGYIGSWYDNAGLTGSALTGIPTGSTGDKSLYAGGWTAITYTIQYHANGGGGTMPSETRTYDDPSQNLTANGFTRSGFTFGGWNTQANGGGTSYANNQSVHNLASTQDAGVILYAQWWPNVSVTVSVWVNQDGSILTSSNNVTISKSASGGNDTGFTAEVSGAYSGVQWYLYGDPVYGGTARSITVNAADYVNGTYHLGVTVTKEGIPYSTNIHFTVKD